MTPHINDPEALLSTLNRQINISLKRVERIEQRLEDTELVSSQDITSKQPHSSSHILKDIRNWWRSIG